MAKEATENEVVILTATTTVEKLQALAQRYAQSSQDAVQRAVARTSEQATPKQENPAP